MRNSFNTILFGCAVTCAAAGADFEWQGRLAPGQSIQIRGVHGSIIATGTSGNIATVRAVKSGTESDPANVKVAPVPYDGGIVICAIYPSPPDAEHPNQCNPPGMDTYVDASDNDVRVDFTVIVPQAVLFSATTVEGDIQAIGLSAHVTADTIDGNVDVSTSGSVQARTLRGSLEVAMGTTDWRGTETLQAGNGNLDVQLPVDADTTVYAAAFSGAIISDFSEITATSSHHGTSSTATGTLGFGARRLRLFTFHGNITIHRGK